jgi:hypothetical protein
MVPVEPHSLAAVVSLLGLAVTIFTLPETKGLSLEELSREQTGSTGALASRFQVT